MTAFYVLIYVFVVIALFRIWERLSIEHSFSNVLLGLLCPPLYLLVLTKHFRSILIIWLIVLIIYKGFCALVPNNPIIQLMPIMMYFIFINLLILHKLKQSPWYVSLPVILPVAWWFIMLWILAFTGHHYKKSRNSVSEEQKVLELKRLVEKFAESRYAKRWEELEIDGL